MSVDYKQLLAKYIEHVGAEEGCTFIDMLYSDSRGLHVGQSDAVSFTAEEVSALKECEKIYHP